MQPLAKSDHCFEVLANAATNFLGIVLRTFFFLTQDLFIDDEQHAHFVETKNQEHQHLRTSLHESVDPLPIQEKINSLNTKWKIVKGATDVHFTNMAECLELLKHFEENFKKMRTWTFESDLNQV